MKNYISTGLLWRTSRCCPWGWIFSPNSKRYTTKCSSTNNYFYDICLHNIDLFDWAIINFSWSLLKVRLLFSRSRINPSLQLFIRILINLKAQVVWYTLGNITFASLRNFWCRLPMISRGSTPSIDCFLLWIFILIPFWWFSIFCSRHNANSWELPHRVQSALLVDSRSSQ